MIFKPMTNDQFMVWFTAIIVLAFFIAGVLDILENFIVKLILFSCFSYVVANIYYALFEVETKKSPEEDSE